MSSSPAVLTPNPSPKSVDWTIVRRRRKSTRSSSAAGNQTLTLTSSSFSSDPTPWTPSDINLDPSRSANLLLKINSTIDRLENSKFYNHFISSFNSGEIQSKLSRLRLSGSDPVRLVVYGIGSFESYPAPRLQLALAELLRRRLSEDVASAEIFDPVLSATECHVAEELGFKVMLTNEHGRRKVKEPTIFFMPHCEAELYNSLLEANWPSDLNRMVLIGNSFSQYCNYVFEAGKINGGSVKIERVAKRLLEIERRKFVREIGIELELGEEMELGFHQAFHDTSWHFFEVGFGGGLAV
ncbi:hypothetical protein LUZ60_003802 [Juncus effusus]|nr:hypothetical protein LUZ60_003802 [Juncus effusus]